MTEIRTEMIELRHSFSRTKEFPFKPMSLIIVFVDINRYTLLAPSKAEEGT